jgi:hypothetical protein
LSLAIEDLDGDQNDDILALVGFALFEVQLGDGMGGFHPARRFSLESWPALMDFDGDGLRDLVVTVAGERMIRRNLGKGRFADPEPVGFRLPDGFAVDLDGRPGDELICSRNGPGRADTLEIWTNRKGRELQGPARVVGLLDGSLSGADEYPLGFRAADFNRDGRMDIVMLGGWSQGPNYVAVFLQEAAGQWKAMPSIYAGQEVVGFAIEDFDLDGAPDIALAEMNSHDPGRTRVLRGLGDGRFEPAGVYYPGDYPVGITAADFDGDGRPDLAVACARRGAVAFHMNVSRTPEPRHVLAIVERAEVDAGAVHVAWSAPGVLHARVERAEHGKHWEEFGPAQVLPSGWLAVSDANVERGRRYGYRLVSMDPQIVIEGSEAWVKLMPRGGVKVSGVVEVASGGSDLALAIEVSELTQTDVEVFDISGRLVGAARGVFLSPGTQRVVVPDTRHVGQGVYWVRVKQGMESVVGRVVVVR